MQVPPPGLAAEAPAPPVSAAGVHLLPGQRRGAGGGDQDRGRAGAGEGRGVGEGFLGQREEKSKRAGNFTVKGQGAGGGDPECGRAGAGEWEERERRGKGGGGCISELVQVRGKRRGRGLTT